METELRGVVEEIVFRNKENGYSVLLVACENELVTCVGLMEGVFEGQSVVLQGIFEEHKEFGRQFKVVSYETEMPNSLEEIERYLGSGIIKGIGPATATAIVRKFGTDALSVIEFKPHRLTEVPGIGTLRAAAIAESYREASGMRQTMIFLKNCGVSTTFATRICRVYGEMTEKTIRANPYCLVEDIEGIGFARADEIAQRLGVALNSSFRIKAAIRYILEEAANQSGHVYLPYAELEKMTLKLVGCEEALFESALEEMESEEKIVTEPLEDGEIVYLGYYHYLEADTAWQFNRLMRTALVLPVDLTREIEVFERQNRIALGDEQKAAISNAVNNGVAVITGGPGTGKTTIINCIIQLLKRRGMSVELAAPTGRAAKRMSEATACEAKTLHRLLEYGRRNEQEKPVFLKNKENPLITDAVIVDEMSMIDLGLMHALLKAMKNGTRLIMVGDADQLPSVGAGNVLKDVIASQVVHVSKLDVVYRQSETSLIIYNAHLINNGEMPIIDNKSSDFMFLTKNNAAEIANAVIDLCARRLPAYYHVDPITGIQVLGPMKKSVAGVQELNVRLQQQLNPPNKQKREIRWNDTVLREGDKVMQFRNNYDIEWIREFDDGGEEKGLGIFNGDCGIIERIDPAENTVTVFFDDKRRAVYDSGTLSQLMLAYAITVHKSQGCEFEIVILPLAPGGPSVLYSRNLLYTAVTRAKKLVLIVGPRETMARMIENHYTAVRYTRLAERLKENDAQS